MHIHAVVPVAELCVEVDDELLLVSTEKTTL
jgi:hypothetical protein